MSHPPKTSRPERSPVAASIGSDSPAYQKKGALCDRLWPRAHDPGWHLLELDSVALGIAHVDRKTGAVRPVAHRRLTHHLDRLSAKIGGDLVQVASLNSDADVIDVESRLDPRIVRRNKVNHAAAGSQLDQSDLRDSTLLAKPQDARVEVVGAILIAASQHDVIDLSHLEWNFHIDTLELYLWCRRVQHLAT